ncbi:MULTISPECIES: multidrug efflux MFS transporter [Citrobacter freundii complex]|uniref:multidrug efflux MFS transporter n=1 Tax=Citrobacter freundii complex TaxID=1344959 RepID=UPI000CDC32B4|nr:MULTISPECIES: multidrug efflux MFS transporter [Citrobacter freundii complex]AUZ68355.1 multidrug transporter subunit MdtG [Citrobacter freundii complex sp. CFNIH4]POU13318.1 multidrug transporter subunit MdtG [Citrobacter freundii complex sp. CFNIH7]POU16851.1 multidrug transporter subunit MdtG [Citrobacter freundii complex sp. CFNIH6]QLR83925.1 multidrug efflux MFS transporter [Citrobacter freundii]HCB1465841.1 multidrug efflux MFS transporter [Citrobacter freundii]
MESWRVNLISVWFGCFFTGLAISQILPFLPLYISQLGVTSHEALSMWSGLTFSVTFLISAIVSPMWGSLADRKGRKLMLLRASLGMAIAILLQAFATNVWQLFLLRGVMGLTSGYIPNAMALVASQVPRERSGWALSTLSTAQISGVIGGPLMGGFIADHVGLRAVFCITAALLVVSFLVTLFLIKEGVRPTIKKSERLSGKAVFASLSHPALVISLFFTTMVIQLCNGSIGPILALFIKSMVPDSSNIAFLSGLIASVSGISALISAPRLGKLGDRIGTERILMATLIFAVVLFFAMSWVTTPLQLGVLRFLLGFADGAMLPAVQTLLVKYSSDQITGRIFGYNQSFMYLGNVAGPLMGATVSAMAGFRWVFIATASIVLINIWQLAIALRRRRGGR